MIVFWYQMNFSLYSSNSERDGMLRIKLTVVNWVHSAYKQVYICYLKGNAMFIMFIIEEGMVASNEDFMSLVVEIICFWS